VHGLLTEPLIPLSQAVSKRWSMYSLSILIGDYRGLRHDVLPTRPRPNHFFLGRASSTDLSASDGHFELLTSGDAR
jgi:hypothetical protein